MAESAPRPVEVVRRYYPDGTLQEEIHYRGGSEHGPWRQWHPNGQLAGEWWLEVGAYMNGTNRTWYPDGTLQMELTYLNGKRIRERRFGPTGKLLPSDQDIQRKSLRKMLDKAGKATPPTGHRRADARSIGQGRAHIDAMLATRHAPALGWLASSSDAATRTLGEFETDLSLELVQRLLAFGAANVLAVQIESSPSDDHKTTNHILIQLPSDPGARARLFAFEGAYARDQGFDPLPDHGQEYLYLMLC